jgi:hypothetical protein
MRRPRLVAFHVMMVVAYSVISGAYAAGWTRLGFAVWVAVFGTCLAILLGCAAIGHAARRSRGRRASFLGWPGQDLEPRWARDEDEAVVRVSEPPECGAAELGAAARIGAEPDWPAGLGPVVADAERPQPAVVIHEGFPLLR